LNPAYADDDAMLIILPHFFEIIPCENSLDRMNAAFTLTLKHFSKSSTVESDNSFTGNTPAQFTKISILEKILEFSKIKGTPSEIQKKFDVSDLDGWDELVTLHDSLKHRGIDNIRINFGIVRGLDYYSGIVFEAYDTTSDLGALVGGGRYDSLPNTFGRNDFGATGVAGGVERIILCLDAQNVSYTPSHDTVSVLYSNEELKLEAVRTASKLRSLGIPTNIDLNGKSLKKQMEISSSSKFSIIFAPQEFSEKQIVLRNMVDRTEKRVSLEELITNPKDILNL